MIVAQNSNLHIKQVPESQKINEIENSASPANLFLLKLAVDHRNVLFNPQNQELVIEAVRNCMSPFAIQRGRVLD